MTTALRTRAEAAATQKLMQLSPGIRFRARPGDLDDWHDSLIPGVSTAGVADDFVQEADDELTDSEDLLAKLRAASSASALAVNTFGPYRYQPERLVIGGLSGFSETRFEYSCPNGLTGTHPHFDFWGAARDGVLAVASKFLEPLDPQTAGFSREYEPRFLGTTATAAVAEARWTAVFQALRDDPETYRYLDAAQLMKYYLGLKHSFPDRRRVLMYLFWEPTNAATLREFRDHRKEIEDFAQRVRGFETSFVALSYPALWGEWEGHSTWPGTADHLALLRARYCFAI